MAMSRRRAFNQLKQTGTKIASFEQWVNENLKIKTRGRKTLVAGSERDYKAQQIEAGGPFLRLPLGALKIEKGQTLSVVFKKDQIIVQRKHEISTRKVR